MKHICAWCKKELAPSDGKDDDKITHGICSKCHEAQMDQIKKIKTETAGIMGWLQTGITYLEKNNHDHA